MTGYNKQFNSSPGDSIDVQLFHTEYDNIEDAFSGTTGHKHNGDPGEGGRVSKISSEPSGLNSISANSVNNEIVFSVNDGGIETPQLKITDGKIEPAFDNDISLGCLTAKYKESFVAGVTNTGSLQLSVGVPVAGILNEYDLGSDSNEALATQASIKAYVDAQSSESGGGGIILQTVHNSRSDYVNPYTNDFTPTASIASSYTEYIGESIETAENSIVHIFATVQVSGGIESNGGVYGRIVRDFFYHGNTIPDQTHVFTPFIVSSTTGGNSGPGAPENMAVFYKDDQLPFSSLDGTYHYSLQLMRAESSVAGFGQITLLEEQGQGGT